MRQWCPKETEDERDDEQYSRPILQSAFRNP